MKDNRFYVWNGFYYEWTHNPHRLAVLGSRFDITEEGCLHEQQIKLGNDELVFNKGEAVPYRCYYSGVKIEEAFVGCGRTAWMEISAERNLPHPVKKVETITVRIDQLTKSQNFSPQSHKRPVHILLNGFLIEPENDHSGWHFGGLGIQLRKAMWIDEHTLSFKCEISIRPANARIEGEGHGNTGWDGKPWTDKMPCIYKVQVDFLILSAEEDIADGSEYMNVHFSARNKLQAALDKELAFKYGQKDYKAAFLGISGFKMTIHDLDNAKGRYIRKLGLYLDNTHHDNKNGVVTTSAENIFSNKGKITFHWKLKSMVKIHLIAVKKGDVSHSLVHNTLTASDLCSAEVNPRRRWIKTIEV